jgi:rhamnogalacturonyl hydrolase YesR
MNEYAIIQSYCDLYEATGNKASSGTAFYCYAFALGINNGLLDKEKYLPVVVKAWNFL